MIHRADILCEFVVNTSVASVSKTASHNTRTFIHTVSKRRSITAPETQSCQPKPDTQIVVLSSYNDRFETGIQVDTLNYDLPFDDPTKGRAK